MKRFEDLLDDQKKEFINAYYAGGKVKEPLEELGVKENFKHIHEVFPPEVLEEKCEYCSKNLLKKRLARNNTNEEAHKASIYCPACNHRPKIEKCNCEKCMKRPERLEEERRKTIREYWGKEREKVDLEKLPFREKVLLGAVLRTSCDEDMKTILPASRSVTKIVPSGGKYLWEMMNSLSAVYKVLIPSTEAPIEAFVLDDTFPNDYYPANMQFNLNLNWPYSDYSLYSELISPTYYSKKSAQAALELWIEIASFECLEYLNYQLDLFGVPHIKGKRTIAVFSSLLTHYSVSEIYSIIWVSVSCAARRAFIRNSKDLEELDFEKEPGEKPDEQFDRLKRQLDKYKSKIQKNKRFKETVMSICQSYCNCTDDTKKRIGSFKRIDELPQSEVSAFFFNQVINIGDSGFYHVPNLKDLGVD